MFKFDLDIMFGILFAMFIVLFTLQAREIKNLQVQVEELRIITNERFLPALIFNKNDFMLR